MANNRKLGRATDHRMAMLRALVTYLLENGKVETTLARAKEVGPLTEKMITLGKKNTLASRRQAMAFVTKEAVVAKLFSEIKGVAFCHRHIRMQVKSFDFFLLLPSGNYRLRLFFISFFGRFFLYNQMLIHRILSHFSVKLCA